MVVEHEFITTREPDDVMGRIAGFLGQRGFAPSPPAAAAPGARPPEGAAFLEMRCRPATRDASFVRGGPTGVKGTSDWTPQVAGFSDPALCHGPVGVELNVVIQGPGTVWIDALRLWTLPAD